MKTLVRLSALIVLGALLVGCGGSEPAITGMSAPTATPMQTAQPLPTATPTAPRESSTVSAPTGDGAGDQDRSQFRRTPFVPLDDPQTLSVVEASYLDDDELVLGLEWNGEDRAYPVRMLTFHHIVNDTVAGRPILITY